MYQKLIASLMLVTFISQFGLAKDEEYVFAGQEFPPFNWQDGTNVTGGTTDIMKQVCSDLKLKCKFVIAPIPRVLKMLEDGEIHGALTFAPTPDRQAYANFSNPVLTTQISYLGIAKTPKIADLNGLAGWTVAAVRGSATGKIAMKHASEVKTMIVIEEVDNETIIKKLAGGRYGEKTLVIGAEEVIQFLAKKLDAKLETVLKADEQNYFVAFSKKSVDAAELELFNKAIVKMKTDGTAKKLLDKYQIKMAN